MTTLNDAQPFPLTISCVFLWGLRCFWGCAAKAVGKGGHPRWKGDKERYTHHPDLLLWTLVCEWVTATGKWSDPCRHEAYLEVPESLELCPWRGLWVLVFPVSLCHVQNRMWVPFSLLLASHHVSSSQTKGEGVNWSRARTSETGSHCCRMLF